MQFLGFILVIFGAIAVLNEFIPLMFWHIIFSIYLWAGRSHPMRQT